MQGCPCSGIWGAPELGASVQWVQDPGAHRVAGCGDPGGPRTGVLGTRCAGVWGAGVLLQRVLGCSGTWGAGVSVHWVLGCAGTWGAGSLCASGCWGAGMLVQRVQEYRGARDTGDKGAGVPVHQGIGVQEYWGAGAGVHRVLGSPCTRIWGAAAPVQEPQGATSTGVWGALGAGVLGCRGLCALGAGVTVYRDLGC